MPPTILAVALLGVGLAGLTVAGAILLGAVLAPTDPALAADVQVGPPQEGGSDLERGDRAVVSVYGVRGIGSMYYLCYAGSHMEFINEDQLWSLIGLVILLSTILHGFSVGWAMDTLDED